MSHDATTRDHRSSTRQPTAGRVLVLVSILGLLVGAALSNLSTAAIEFDESRTLGAACEHAEAALIGGPIGLLTGLAGAAAFVLLRRRAASLGSSLVVGVTSAFMALLLIIFLLYPLSTSYLLVSVCPY